jgi:peptidoglycan/LPS O-acetylase OafA/YrhL
LKINDEEAILPNLFIRTAFSAVIFWVLGHLLIMDLPKPLQFFFTNKTIVYLGKISYGIYVFHNFMPWLFMKLGIYKNFHLSIPFYFVCFGITTFLLASVSWRFFEKPINDWKKKFMYRGEAA